MAQTSDSDDSASIIGLGESLQRSVDCGSCAKERSSHLNFKTGGDSESTSSFQLDVSRVATEIGVIESFLFTANVVVALAKYIYSQNYCVAKRTIVAGISLRVAASPVSDLKISNSSSDFFYDAENFMSWDARVVA